MSKIETEFLNEEAKTLDEYIFDYFNNAYPNLVSQVVDSWKKLQDKNKEASDE